MQEIRLKFLICWVFVGLLTFGPQMQSANAEVDPASVQRAIDRGIAYLRKTQTERGGWEEYPGQSCGLSALCTLALLNAGVPREDPTIVRAVSYLRTFNATQTYSVSLQTLVYCQLGAAGDLPRIRQNVDWLIANQKRSGTPNQIGSWDYGNNNGSGDPSNSQFALLALDAAQERGIEINPAVFQLSLDYWLKRQRNGGWNYGSSRDLTGSMTCAGIASIIIARNGLDQASSRVNQDRIECCGGKAGESDPVDAGLEWLGKNFTLQVNPGGGASTLFYYMYALERVGRLTGRRFIGEHDWYREGAERLLSNELLDEFRGFWGGFGGTESMRDVTTAFALLFLSKGKRQVVVGRLKYADDQSANQWQQHPDSLRQLVRHVERDWGRDLTWQTVDAEQAKLEDLLQSPVLIISGNRALEFKPELVQRLKDYLDQGGGCILFEAEGGDGCGDASGFEASVQELCSSWYPGAQLERLPPSHPVWFAEHPVDPTAISEDFWVYGVQACCRTAVFYVPQSLSCRWELSDALFHRDRVSKSAQAQITAAVRVGENLIAYATGRELKDKLEQRVVLEGAAPEAARDTVQLASLSLDAGGQEAQRALPNAASLIGTQLPISISATPEPVGFDAQQLSDVPFLWIHGRTDFTLDDAQRKVLRAYVENGGIILGTAICGNEAFAAAFRRELALILPAAPLLAVPPSHPMMKADGGFDLSNVTIRTPAVGGQAGKRVRRRTGIPVLETATVDNLVGVVFSPLDLSCALESPNSVQCPGYSTEDAAKIVANLVLFCLQQ
jgi:Domain of unknown function (DUF4159)